MKKFEENIKCARAGLNWYLRSDVLLVEVTSIVSIFGYDLCFFFVVFFAFLGEASGARNKGNHNVILMCGSLEEGISGEPKGHQRAVSGVPQKCK